MSALGSISQAILREFILRDYPCFSSSSVESCISAHNRDGRPCPFFDECVELTETARLKYQRPKQKPKEVIA